MIHIRQLDTDDIETVQDFTERAFAPIFESWRGLVGGALFDRMFSDWQEQQRGHVTTFFNDQDAHNWIATVDDVPAGYIVLKFNHETKQGVVEFLVVSPDYQRQGIGSQLNQFAIEQMQEQGMEVVEVGTGGDEAHAPARRAYEKMGYVGIPGMYYYKDLRD
ncbi:MAG: GNAT family N-acetyltransferase [Chloroflexota bacterium]